MRRSGPARQVAEAPVAPPQRRGGAVARDLGNDSPPCGPAIVVIEGIQQLFQLQTNWTLYRSTWESLKREKYLSGMFEAGYPLGPNERFQIFSSSFPKLHLAHPFQSIEINHASPGFRGPGLMLGRSPRPRSALRAPLNPLFSELVSAKRH